MNLQFQTRVHSYVWQVSVAESCLDRTSLHIRYSRRFPKGDGTIKTLGFTVIHDTRRLTSSTVQQLAQADIEQWLKGQ